MKNNYKSFSAFLLFFFSFLFIFNISLFAQTTYTWIGANNAAWTTSINWSPTRTTPATIDVLQFTDGTTKNVTSVPTQTIGRLLVNTNTNITLQGSGTVTLTVGNGAGDDIVISSGSSITIGGSNAFTITLASNATAAISGTLTINSGHTYNTNGTNVVTTVSGFIVNAGTITNSTTTKLIFNSGSSYQHLQNGGTIPTATWNANSTCSITNITTTNPSFGSGQTFGNFTWNCPGQGTNANFNALFNIGGNFTLISTGGSGIFRFAVGTTTITGNYSQTGGINRLVGGTARTFNIGGNFSLNGGEFRMSSGGATATFNVAGNFSHTGGTITENSTGSGLIVFNGSGIQTYTSGVGTVSNTINFTVNSGATLYLGTSLLGNGSIGTFSLSSSGTLGIGHPDGISITNGVGNIRVTGTKTYTAGANYIYNGTAAQVTGNGLPTSAITGNVTIANILGVTPTNNINISGTLTVNGLLTPTAAQIISGSGTLTGNGTVRVTRTVATADFSSQYTITNKTLTNLTVDYAGAAAQIISALAYGGLRVNNLSGLTLGGNVSINGAFTVTSGRVTLGANNITLGSSATISGTPSATAMVVATSSGELRKTFLGIGSFTFPVGDNTGTAEYSPVTLNFTSGTFSSAYAGVRLVNSKHPNNTSSNDYINRYWTVSSSGISSFSCNTTFTYVDNDINGTEANLYCGSWNGSLWTLLNAANTVANQLTGTVTTFSDFTGGEQAALPVELSSFSAVVLENGVKLKWRTETEVNNYGFEIHRAHTSTPLSVTEWDVLGFVEGIGNSNSPKDYSFVDGNVIAGKYYYRLKQIDNDGNFEYSKVIDVDLGSPIKFELSQNYPNPFNPVTTIQFSVPESGNVKLIVYNLLGEQVTELVNGIKEAGVYSINFNAENLNSGMYIYRMETNGFVQSKKMTLIK